MTLCIVVYLKTDPKVAFQRIAQRGRSEENGITLEYLQSVHDLHEDWLCNNKFKLPAPVSFYFLAYCCIRIREVDSVTLRRKLLIIKVCLKL